MTLGPRSPHPICEEEIRLDLLEELAQSLVQLDKARLAGDDDQVSELEGDIRALKTEIASIDKDLGMMRDWP